MTSPERSIAAFRVPYTQESFSVYSHQLDQVSYLYTWGRSLPNFEAYSYTRRMKYWWTEGIAQFKVDLEGEEAKYLKQTIKPETTDWLRTGDKCVWRWGQGQRRVRGLQLRIERQWDVTLIKWREALLVKLIGPILLEKFKGSISNLPYKPQIFIEWQLLCFELCPGHIGEHSRFWRSSKCIRTD